LRNIIHNWGATALHTLSDAKSYRIGAYIIVRFFNFIFYFTCFFSKVSLVSIFISVIFTFLTFYLKFSFLTSYLSFWFSLNSMTFPSVINLSNFLNTDSLTTCLYKVIHWLWISLNLFRLQVILMFNYSSKRSIFWRKVCINHFNHFMILPNNKRHKGVNPYLVVVLHQKFPGELTKYNSYNSSSFIF
jgi:hypothetical protein